MQKIVLTVPDMVCGACAKSIRNALAELAEIAKIETSPENRRVSVAGDELNIDSITAAIDEAGFSVEEVHASD